MRYQAYATDYDGTIANHGALDAATLGALRSVKASGRTLILVSGRTHDCFDDEGPSPKAFNETDLFNCIVSENGGVLYYPATGTTKLLAPQIPHAVRTRLENCGVDPMWVGKIMISCMTTNEAVVEAALRDAHLNYDKEYNRDWVMFVPKGVNKARGLRAALAVERISPSRAVGTGDSFNDCSFLRICGQSFAVGDADPIVRKVADHVTSQPGPLGAQEVMRSLALHDLSDWGRGHRSVA